VALGCHRHSRAAVIAKAMPPKSIRTFATANIARKGFFYAGGRYWGESSRAGEQAGELEEYSGAFDFRRWDLSSSVRS
jgi:hypothetical protein